MYDDKYGDIKVSFSKIWHFYQHVNARIRQFSYSVA